MIHLKRLSIGDSFNVSIFTILISIFAWILEKKRCRNIEFGQIVLNQIQTQVTVGLDDSQRSKYFLSITTPCKHNDREYSQTSIYKIMMWLQNTFSTRYFKSFKMKIKKNKFKFEYRKTLLFDTPRKARYIKVKWKINKSIVWKEA